VQDVISKAENDLKKDEENKKQGIKETLADMFQTNN